jgi:hypothetical protein
MIVSDTIPDRVKEYLTRDFDVVKVPDRLSRSCSQSGCLEEDPYISLRYVLELAVDQAANGKGKERHANGEPFDQQKICKISRAVGVGFALGQALKKAEESIRLDKDAGLREILGAINYLAAAYIVLNET